MLLLNAAVPCLTQEELGASQPGVAGDLATCVRSLGQEGSAVPDARSGLTVAMGPGGRLFRRWNHCGHQHIFSYTTEHLARFFPDMMEYLCNILRWNVYCMSLRDEFTICFRRMEQLKF